MQYKSIGIFDFGFGGLTILREIVKKLPEYDYIYLGDTARAPYGSHSQELIYQFTKQAVTFLFEQECELIILACNTASSEALRKIQREYLPKYYYDKRVLGVIIPTTEVAIKLTKDNRVGIIATEATIHSGTFEREFKKLNPKIKCFLNACPLLVPIVETGQQNSKMTNLILKKYLKPLIKKDIDSLILGCTHYSLLEDKIRKILNQNINIISEDKIIAIKLKDYLERHLVIKNKITKNSRIRFLTTDLSDKFKTMGSQFFGKAIFPEKVIIS